MSLVVFFVLLSAAENRSLARMGRFCIVCDAAHWSRRRAIIADFICWRPSENQTKARANASGVCGVFLSLRLFFFPAEMTTSVPEARTLRSSTFAPSFACRLHYGVHFFHFSLQKDASLARCCIPSQGQTCVFFFVWMASSS